MARALNEIKAQITTAFIDNETVQQFYELTPGQSFEEQFSLVSIESILFDIVAFAIWVLESLFDVFRQEIQNKIDASKPFTLKWYKAVALGYQHGFTIDEDGEYINGTATEEQILSSKIVAQVAFEKTIIQGHGVLRCKTAKEEGGELVKLTPEELEGFDYYMNKKTVFGLRVVCISREHDKLQLSLKVWYDPQILDSQGRRKDGTNDTPVIDAINDYLRNIDFNGSFVKTYLTDALQQVPGVKIPKILSAQSSWSSFAQSTESSQYAGPIDEIRPTFAGYMRLDVENSTFQYVPYG